MVYFKNLIVNTLYTDDDDDDIWMLQYNFSHRVMEFWQGSVVFR